VDQGQGGKRGTCFILGGGGSSFQTIIIWHNPQVYFSLFYNILYIQIQIAHVL
jgi:hypothetical protein